MGRAIGYPTSFEISNEIKFCEEQYAVERSNSAKTQFSHQN